MALQDNPTLSNMKEEIDNKVNRSGDTLTGQLVLSQTGFKTYSDNGYYLNSAGEMVHTTTNTANSFKIKSYDDTTKFTVQYESGNITTQGTISANGNITTNGEFTAAGRILTTNAGGFKIKQSDTDNSASSISYNRYSSFGMVDVGDRFVGYCEFSQLTDGTTRATIASRKFIDNQNYNNGVTLSVLNDKTRTVTFSDPSAWKTGLQLYEYYENVSAEAVSVPNNTETDMLSVTLSKGLYLFHYMLSFATNSSGYRYGYMGDGMNNSGYLYQVSTRAASDMRTNIQCTGFFNITDDSKTLHLYAKQNSGGALSVTPRIQYIKLKP